MSARSRRGSKARVRSEDVAEYLTHCGRPAPALGSEDEIVETAMLILARRLASGPVMSNPAAVRQYLCTKLAPEPDEVFGALYLDTRHHVIAFEALFRGTIDSATVHPRALVRGAMERNASAVILAHNHPSGNPEPSRADAALTARIRDALALIDVAVLDHFIIAGARAISMAESGLV